MEPIGAQMMEQMPVAINRQFAVIATRAAHKVDQLAPRPPLLIASLTRRVTTKLLLPPQETRRVSKACLRLLTMALRLLST